MPSAPKRLSIVLALLALVPASASASPAPDAAVGHVRPVLDTVGEIDDYGRTASSNRFVILQAWQTDRLRALKAADPRVRVLVYKNLSFSAELPPSHNGPSPSGVAHAEAPDAWFLRNKSGQRFTSWGFGWLWAMDVGHPGYQARWAENVVAELQAEGWDGVFMDDANATMKYHYSVPEVARYPSDAAYSAATGSALAAIGPRIRAAGKLAVPNFAAWVEYPETYNGWLEHVDGALDEMFLKWSRSTGEGYRPEAQWRTQVAAAKYATSRGKSFLAFTQSSADDAQAARYGYASLLLASNGDASFALTPDHARETWFPEYDYDLGRPLGDYTRDASGVHRRRFERGLVLVNPTDRSQDVSFGAAYSGSGLQNAASATMRPHTGLVLTGGPPAPAPGPAPAAPAVPLATLAASSDDAVALRWTRGPERARRYRVLRNGRRVRTVRRPRMVDRRVRPGRVQRYRVIALDRRGRVVGRSRPIVIRAGRKHTARRLRVSVTGPRGRWRRVRVEMRRRGAWRRVAQRPRLRRRMSFALPARPGRVRVVVTSAEGRVLSSRSPG